MSLIQADYASPIGTLRLVSDGEGLVGLYLPDHKREPLPVAEGSDAVLTEASRQLDRYFAGESAEFDLPLRAKGTPFQQTVWAELRRIPRGETISYGELAKRIGQPTAVRAVAGANARNPISIVVPCHRVIGTSGKLTGYAGGLTAKEYLLGLERE
ncbi:methylated-DNA--[protein]-cysteine S-methyltransferase [bacterium]|nr:MAG: methylated-DNA--[protein]-cysteine S-methyltransferase [bacterium]